MPASLAERYEVPIPLRRSCPGCVLVGWTDCSIGAYPDSPRLWSQLHLAGAPGVCVWCARWWRWDMDRQNVTVEVSPDACNTPRPVPDRPVQDISPSASRRSVTRRIPGDSAYPGPWGWPARLRCLPLSGSNYCVWWLSRAAGFRWNRSEPCK